MQTRHSTSLSASNTWKPLKRMGKPEIRVVKNFSPTFTKQDLNNNCFNKALSLTEDKEMEISNVEEVVGIEKKDHEVIFWDREPQTDVETTAITKTKTASPTTTTNPTTIPTPNNNQQQGRQLTLYHPNGWYNTWQKTSTLLSQLEKNYNLPMATFSSERRFQDPILSTTNTMEAQTDTPETRRSIRSGRSGLEVFKCTNYRIITIPAHWFPIEFFHHPRDQQASTYFRLSDEQSFYPVPTFQNGGSTSTSRHTGRERLYLQVGSQGCLRSYSNSSRIQEISNVLTPGQGISIQDISFWNEREFQGIQQTNEICHGTSKEKRNPVGILSRRHLHFGKDKNGSLCTHNDSNITFRESGLCDKQRKEYINTFSTAGFSRFYIQLEENDDISSEQETVKNQDESEPSSELINEKIMSWIARLLGKMTSVIPAIGKALLHIFTKGSSEKSTPKQSTMGSDLNNINAESTRIVMVEDVKPTLKWFAKRKTPITPDLVIHVDASDSGWGVSSDHINTAGLWIQQEQLQSINV